MLVFGVAAALAEDEQPVSKSDYPNDMQDLQRSKAKHSCQ